MNKKSLTRVLAVAAAALLILAACGSDDDSSSGSSSEASAPATTEAAMSMTPGEGVSVTSGRANWSTGYVQAEIYTALLRELGYTVSESADMELGPQNAFMAMASGDMDFWANSWMPGHQSWLNGEMTDGSLVADHVTVVGEEMVAGGLQGMLITKGFAEEYQVWTLEDLDNNADAIAAYDATDANPGNGMVDIMGCPEDWTCDNIISNQITYYGWDNIEQTIAGYDAMFAQATDLANAGEPMAIYTWTPSAYVTTLIPGDNVLWLTMNADDILDDSNPNGDEGGEFHDQRPGFDGFGADFCTQPCQLGWKPADIQVTASNDFLAANPFLEALFPLMRPSVIDISILQVEQANGDGSEAEVESIAAGWIADNQDLVSSWLEEAAVS